MVKIVDVANFVFRKALAISQTAVLNHFEWPKEVSGKALRHTSFWNCQMTVMKPAWKGFKVHLQKKIKENTFASISFSCLKYSISLFYVKIIKLNANMIMIKLFQFYFKQWLYLRRKAKPIRTKNSKSCKNYCTVYFLLIGKFSPFLSDFKSIPA